MAGSFRKPAVSRNHRLRRRLHCTRDKRHASTRFLCFAKGLTVSEKIKRNRRGRGGKSICKGEPWRNVSETGKTGSVLSVRMCACAAGIADAATPASERGNCATGSLLCYGGPPPMALLTRCRISRIAAAAAAAGASERDLLGSRSGGRENGSGTGPA